MMPDESRSARAALAIVIEARDTAATDGQSPTLVVQAAVVSTLSGYGSVATGAKAVVAAAQTGGKHAASAPALASVGLSASLAKLIGR